MANRLGLLDPSELDTEQKHLYDGLAEYTTRKYGDRVIVRDDQNRFIGPFGIQLHTPYVGEVWLQFTQAIAKIPDLPKECRETVILVVGARTGAKYENYAHQSLSGFSKADLDTITSGKCPDGFSEKQKMAYAVAFQLGKFGPLPKEMWDESIKVLGRNATTSLIHYTGFYSYIATILNGFDAQEPEGH